MFHNVTLELLGQQGKEVKLEDTKCCVLVTLYGGGLVTTYLTIHNVCLQKNGVPNFAHTAGLVFTCKHQFICSLRVIFSNSLNWKQGLQAYVLAAMLLVIPCASLHQTTCWVFPVIVTMFWRIDSFTSFLLAPRNQFIRFLAQNCIQGVWPEIYNLKFFHKIVSSGHLGITLRQFQFFSEICRDIRK